MSRVVRTKIFWIARKQDLSYQIGITLNKANVEKKIPYERITTKSKITCPNEHVSKNGKVNLPRCLSEQIFHLLWELDQAYQWTTAHSLEEHCCQRRSCSLWTNTKDDEHKQKHNPFVPEPGLFYLLHSLSWQKAYGQVVYQRITHHYDGHRAVYSCHCARFLTETKWIKTSSSCSCTVEGGGSFWKYLFLGSLL